MSDGESDYNDFRNTHELRLWAIEAIDKLLKIRTKAHPAGGAETAKDKDFLAVDALAWTRKLVEEVAGWAIDHQVGLVLGGGDFVGSAFGPVGAMPEHKEARSAANDHRHEELGRSYRDGAVSGSDPGVDRRALRRLLLSNPGAFPERLARLAADGLEALDYGETQPLLDRARDGRKVDLTEQKLMLRALEFLEYRRGRGTTKGRAGGDVAAAYGVSAAALLKWQQRLRESLGTVRVSETLAIAKDTAERVEMVERSRLSGERLPDPASAYYAIADWADKHYGNLALAECGRRFREAQRIRAMRNQRDKRHGQAAVAKTER